MHGTVEFSIDISFAFPPVVPFVNQVRKILIFRFSSAFAPMYFQSIWKNHIVQAGKIFFEAPDDLGGANEMWDESEALSSHVDGPKKPEKATILTVESFLWEWTKVTKVEGNINPCLLYTSPSPRD